MVLASRRRAARAAPGGTARRVAVPSVRDRAARSGCLADRRVPAAARPVPRLVGWRTLTGTWPGRSLAARSGPALSCRPVRCRVAACWSRRLWWCLLRSSCVTPDGFWWPGLPLPVGVALLTFGLVGLMEGRWVAYGAGGLLGAGAWLAGVAVAHPAAAASRAVDACSRQKVSHDRLSQPPVDPHLPRV